MTFRLSSDLAPGTALAVLAAVLLTVSGCSVVDDIGHGRAQTTYDNPDELAQARGQSLDWLPADARSITRVSSTRAADTESLLFTSASGLAGCDEVERRSAPTMQIDSAPDVYTIDDIALCGTWAVAESDGTFYAWTPAIEAEGVSSAG